ncbi:thioesterase II family protein [Saccharopolyspora spinosa]|uniref:thioesterase II family protein n=1 Tax=Saccharopolyspora spinosa TaxID=60894 RepID=UPI000011DB07
MSNVWPETWTPGFGRCSSLLRRLGFRRDRDDARRVPKSDSCPESSNGVLISPEVCAPTDFRRGSWRPLSNDYRAVETYRCAPGAKVGCPITVLVVDAEPKVTLDEAEAWREHTEAVADVRVFSGGHFFMTERQDEVLAVLTGGSLR